MKGRTAALVMAGLLVLYLALVVQQAFHFMSTGVPVAVALGVCLLVFPLIGFWALGVELLFGIRTERLVKILAREGQLPVDDLPRRASGRPTREAADAAFPQYQLEVESTPDNWAAWFRLGLAYDACGDRKRARAALRRSISLERAAS